jgi:5'-nucleotidase
LWDHHMVDGFDYENLIKIWFLNDKVDELLDEYKKRYDIVIVNDGGFCVVNEIIGNIKS